MQLVVYPDTRLRVKSALVEQVTDSVRSTLRAMLDVMYTGNGIGLAASQVGIHKRMFVVDVQNGRSPLYFVNPTISKGSEETSTVREGCLSLPGAFGEVERSARVQIRFLNFNGFPSEMVCSGILATVVQHEIDHLDGVMHIDKMESIQKRRALQGAWEARISRPRQ